MRVLALIALCGFALSGSARAAERVEILRDEYNVPHIFAATVRGAAYSYGYAQASDRADQLIRHLRGSPTKPPSAGVSPRLRAIVEAYCAGANDYFAKHPPGSSPGSSPGSPPKHFHLEPS